MCTIFHEHTCTQSLYVYTERFICHLVVHCSSGFSLSFVTFAGLISTGVYFIIMDFGLDCWDLPYKMALTVKPCASTEITLIWFELKYFKEPTQSIIPLLMLVLLKNWQPTVGPKKNWYVKKIWSHFVYKSCQTHFFDGWIWIKYMYDLKVQPSYMYHQMWKDLPILKYSGLPIFLSPLCSWKLSYPVLPR